LRQAAPHLQALAVGGPRTMRALLAERLAPAGLNRVCAPGHLQRPPLAWSHDGRGCLRPLVRWTDIE
ncbi:MAG TPA: acyl-CoA reductase, partial [Haliangium sp.]|nr:acyl-CoA reductase [Haliangium sp.]